MPDADFETLELIFRRTGSLPALPSTAVQLIKIIDSGEASASSLERIIASDPALSAEFLRMASVAAAGGVPRYSTIRGAIILLGQRTVRSLAMSLILRSMSFSKPKTRNFDSAQFSRHSLAVAMLARFLFARKQMQSRPSSDWSPDEVFSVGILSSLGIGLLAQVVPDAYDRIYHFSERAGITLEEGFQRIFLRPSTMITSVAVEAWGLPSVFSEALVHLHQPWAYPQEFTALCCLNYAISLSDSHDLGIGMWPVDVKLQPEIEFETGLSDQEATTLVNAVKFHVDDWTKTSGRAA